MENWWTFNIEAVQRVLETQSEPLSAEAALALCRAVLHLQRENERLQLLAHATHRNLTDCLRLAIDLLEQREACEDQIEELEFQLER